MKVARATAKDIALMEGRSVFRVHTPHFYILYIPHPGKTSKLSPVVSKKVIPTAVGRNAVKRKVRAAIQKQAPKLLGGCIGLIHIKKRAEKADFLQVNTEIAHLFSRITSS